jgi:hypothetical protein
MDLRPLANSTLIVVAVTYGLALCVAAFAGLGGIWLGFMISLSLWRYAYEVLREVARGRTILQPPGIESANPVGEINVVLHCVFFSVLLYFLATTPLVRGSVPLTALRWLALGLTAFAFPASAALMGLTTSPLAAFNPFSIATVIRVLGEVYWKLLGVAAALIGFVGVVDAWLGSRGFGAWLLASCVGVWCFLALFALIGSAMGERRREFDIPGEYERRAERDERWQDGERQKTLDIAYGSIRSGLPAQGYRTIKELLERERDSLEIYQWTFNRMLEWQDRSHALELAQRFVVRLLESKREYNALLLVDQCRKLSPGFTLPAEVAARLAAYARSVGKHRIADDLGAAPPVV